MADLISNGISSLIAKQAELATISHNIANADTPGYSRQETLLATVAPQETGAGFIGNGVKIDGVRRIVDEFAVKEYRSSATNYNSVDRLLENSQQLDNLLGQESTGLSPVLQRFFSSVQTAAENPSSVASRQATLSESELLVNRVRSIYSSLERQNSAINTQLQTYTAQLSSLADSVANLNARISAYAGRGQGALPNDLLDRREHLIQQISELVGVNVIEESNNLSSSIFIGKGQSLVTGIEAFNIFSQPGETDLTRHEVIYQNGSSSQNITDNMSGGKIGGLLDFRSQILDETYNQLGLVALGLSHAVNEQHQLGMDLDGQLGGFFFRDVNETRLADARTVADPDNFQAGDESISLTINDISSVTTSDYELQFANGVADSYTITRLSDNTVVATNTFNGVFPATAEFDGVVLTMNSGNFGPADRFDIYITRFGAREMNLEVSSVRDLAFAQPVRARSSETNRGTANISQGTVLDTSTSLFTNNAGTLSPPLVVRFTSAQRYDVLDNTDPTNPRPLVPPIVDQEFLPGISNNLFPEDLNQSSVVSDGTAVGTATQNAVLGTFVNGFAAEDAVFTTIDPDTQAITRQTYTSVANASAQTTADELSLLTGVTASARNYAVLSDISSNTPMSLTFNGRTFNLTTASALADQLNADSVLSQNGISALSDGSSVTLRSTQGANFEIAIAGGATDTLSVTGANGSSVTLVGSDAIPEVTVAGTLDVVLEEGLTVNGEGTLFSTIPTHHERFLGIQVSLNGTAEEGDTFYIEYNENGFSDNRNALAIGDLQTTASLFNSSSTFRDGYSNLVDFIGTKTSEATLSREAALTLLEGARSAREEVSGVNTDEEAAALVKAQQAYQASAQLISVARSSFESLLNAVNG